MRVVTLNIWNKSGPWQQRMALIRKQLQALDPDILGLQEVLELETPSVTMNQADELRGVLAHRAYGAAHDLMPKPVEGQPKLRFGNAILSRWPIAHHEVFALPGDDESDQRRCLLRAVIDAPFGTLNVFVTHLNWKLDEGFIREKQVKAIARIIADKSPDDGRYPPILMGDMNAEPHSDEIRYLGGYTRLGDARGVRFSDAWDYATDRDHGFSFDGTRNPFAAQVHEHPRRIDYIFVRGPDEKGRGVPTNVRLCFDEPEGEVFPSDHFGVVAELSE